MNPLIQKIEAKYKKETIPEVRVGNMVNVALKVVEGKRERIQNFEGLIIAKKGTGLNALIRVRKISHNEVGVERTVFLHSPKLENITVIREGKPRQAKLFYLRNRKGKAALKVKAPIKHKALQVKTPLKKEAPKTDSKPVTTDEPNPSAV